MKFLKVYETEAKHNVLIPIDRIKSMGVSKHGGSYILTDTESFFTDRQLDDIHYDVLVNDEDCHRAEKEAGRVAIDSIQRLRDARSIPASALCFFRDGDKWCCVNGDFDNLQESPAGFGDTFEEALANLATERAGRVDLLAETQALHDTR